MHTADKKSKGKDVEDEDEDEEDDEDEYGDDDDDDDDLGIRDEEDDEVEDLLDEEQEEEDGKGKRKRQKDEDEDQDEDEDDESGLLKGFVRRRKKTWRGQASRAYSPSDQRMWWCFARHGVKKPSKSSISHEYYLLGGETWGEGGRGGETVRECEREWERSSENVRNQCLMDDAVLVPVRLAQTWVCKRCSDLSVPVVWPDFVRMMELQRVFLDTRGAW